jgi:hypothetical protein
VINNFIEILRCSYVAVEETQFFVLVTAEWLERNAKAARGTRTKKCTETKNTPGQVTVLSLTRTQFVAAALAAHGLQNSYVAGPVSGPNMKISWNGSPCVSNFTSQFLCSFLNVAVENLGLQ